MQAQFEQMDVEQLKGVYLAVKAALVQKLGGAGPGPEGSAPPPAAPPAPPEASAPPAPAFKSEVKASPGSGGKVTVEKSESATIKELEAKLAEKQSEIEQLATIVVDVVGQPVRKAITEVSVKPTADVSKLSRTEIDEQLRTKVRNGLAKSDRELVKEFYRGSVSLEKLGHLLVG